MTIEEKNIGGLLMPAVNGIALIFDVMNTVIGHAGSTGFAVLVPAVGYVESSGSVFHLALFPQVFVPAPFFKTPRQIDSVNPSVV